MIGAPSKLGPGEGKMAEKSETKLDDLIKRDYLVAELLRSFWQANPQSK
jgi:hypothetical protein